MPRNAAGKQPKILIIGAGVGGLATAGALAKAGLDVTVLEAHVYPGGCAGTFFHKGYRFDAGATLAGGFYPGGPMDLLAEATGVDDWNAHPAEPAMTVHLADGSQVRRWADEQRWDEYRDHFGAEGERFFRWQEERADALWDLALRIPPWPPQSTSDVAKLVRDGLSWIGSNPLTHLSPALLADAFQPVSAHLQNAAPKLRQFVDAQLLIAAQTTSEQTFALYGASALDLPRRGVVHLSGGIGAIAEKLVTAIQRNGGAVKYRQQVKSLRRVQVNGRSRWIARSKRGEEIVADLVIANLPPWNLAALLQENPPARLRNLPDLPMDGWGAVMVYAGIDADLIPQDFPLHHQIVTGSLIEADNKQSSKKSNEKANEMGEGNTLFLSFSPAWDQTRAPAGQRLLTMSTHTRLQAWWQSGNACSATQGEVAYARASDEQANYEAQKQAYLQKMMDGAVNAFSWLHEAVKFRMVGTPITFRRFTRRHGGWVGGFPQTNLLRTWAPKIAPGLWMVGDSIFPGQSTAAVALGGLRVANGVMQELAR